MQITMNAFINADHTGAAAAAAAAEVEAASRLARRKSHHLPAGESLEVRLFHLDIEQAQGVPARETAQAARHSSIERDAACQQSVSGR